MSAPEDEEAKFPLTRRIRAFVQNLVLLSTAFMLSIAFSRFACDGKFDLGVTCGVTLGLSKPLACFGR